jgi:hypothetical protein
VLDCKKILKKIKKYFSNYLIKIQKNHINIILKLQYLLGHILGLLFGSSGITFGGFSPGKK